MKKKACVYARVSTEHLEQDGSLKAQMRYFTEKYNDKYEIIEVYAEKETGTSIKKRNEFQKLLKDAGLELEEKRGNINIYNTNKESKFNYILVKSVSRFSRNTETISIIRKLKSQGVYVIYDDINKTTESEDDEMLLGIMQQMAQQESVEKSRIVKWGKKRSAEANRIPMSIIPYGYIGDLENNKLIAEPRESEVVKLIFNLYVNEHKGVRVIKSILNKKGIRNREGKEFTERSLLYIIQNCKYCGINLRNRYVRNDLYNKNSKIELSEEEWIKLKNDRIDIIITEEMFDKAQVELESRRINGKGYKGFSKSPYSGKITCQCGGIYIHNKFKNGDKEPVGFYVCNRRKKIGKVKSGCNSRNIMEYELEKEINSFYNDRHEKILLKKINKAIDILEKKEKDILNTNTDNMEIKLKDINSKLANNKNKIEKLIDMMLDSSETKTDVLNEKISILEKENKTLEVDKNNLNTIIDNKNSILKNVSEFKNLLYKIKDEEGNKQNKKDFIENEIISIQLDKNDKIKITTKMMVIIDSFILTALEFDINKNFNNNFKNIIEKLKIV